MLKEITKIELNAEGIAKLVAEKYNVPTTAVKYHYNYYKGDAREPEYLSFVVEIDTDLVKILK